MHTILAIQDEGTVGSLIVRSIKNNNDYFPCGIDPLIRRVLLLFFFSNRMTEKGRNIKQNMLWVVSPQKISMFLSFVRFFYI